MKICPQCQTTYTDDDLKFCLQDGTPLVNQPISQNWGETETVVLPKNYDRTQVEWQNPPAPNWANSERTQVTAPPKRARTGLIIALTALITLLVAGGVIAGYLFYRNNQNTETARNNTNTKPLNISVPNTANGNQKSNVNVSVASLPTVSPSPTVAPSVKPALNPKEAETIRSDIENVLEDWKTSTENHDLDAHLDNYADTVNYYRGGEVSSAKVRADREKAFSMYDTLEVSLDNIEITPDATGEKAVVTLDKKWDFQNDVKSNSGKVRQQLTLAKIQGRWLIIGERDLKVYYVNK